MTSPGISSRPGPARRIVAAAAAALLALTGAAALAVGPQALPAAADPAPQCPPDGEFPGIGNDPLWTDDNVAVYAGGNYTATGGAAESEGLLLVRGDATFEAPGNFSVGTVGAGSQIVPTGGSVMLAVGGDMTVADGTSVTVGSLVPGGGAVNVGGSLTASGALSTEGTDGAPGAPVQTGLGQAAAMAPYATFQDVVVDASADLAALPGTPADVTGNQLRITGPGAGEPAPELFVVTVDAADLAGVTEIYVDDMPQWTPIAVNVTGTADVTFSPNYVAWNGDRVDGTTSPDIGNASSALLWNFAQTPTLEIGGSSQFIGTILAPAADTTITASTNGRVLVGGDLTTSGVGNEQHNYPWIGPGPFACVTGGTFTVVKEVVGSGAQSVPADTEFTVDYSYEADGSTVTGTLVVRADGVPVTGPAGLAEGTVVTLAEGDLPDVDGVTWGAPVFTPSASVTIGADETVAVTLTNTADTVDPTQTGGFTLAKDVTGEAAGAVPDDTEFTVGYSYELAGETVTGTLTVLADGAVVAGPQDLPAGTEVTFTEIDLPEVDGVLWGEPVFAPSATITVLDGEDVAVTLTNTALVADETGGFSMLKVVDGDGAPLVPADTEFSVWFGYELGEVLVVGELVLLADGTVTEGPQDLADGTEVFFAEADLPEVAGITWGEPVFSVDGEPGDTLTIGAGEQTEITLTNTAVSQGAVGGFSVAKSVTGTAASTVPDDTEFTVAYAYEQDGEPVTGTLAVLADGTVVDGPQDLPAGTVVSLDEVDLPAFDGVSWGTPVFTVDGDRVTTVTVPVDASVEIELTNTATGTGGALATTGGDVAVLATLAGLLVGGGVLTLVLARRRRA
ncbi:DUF5979 domain-containing protein [Oerskovia flava]|uniref:DUF5979 domain-containing protein n=1 Tax=Oerskovia flava TaxID=2986422 RepID=UPI00223F2A38|nr:DUF5979 domain-containing protein [Oerskovia sp. JB1-3-2]